MKMKVGAKLHLFRQERHKTQEEFADLLGMSPSAYARLERNETQADFESVLRYANILGVPVQEFFPESLVFHNKNEGTGAGVIFGNYIVNVNKDEYTTRLEQENSLLQEKITLLEARIAELIDTNQTLKEVLRKLEP